ncbi:MAG: 2OG-Fe(II) oxygenase [Proteobacteria bacterium]|nr:2OG-Fe(II) oxygenase [Pseudomonadota bacterium]
MSKNEKNTFSEQSLDNIADALNLSGYIILNDALDRNLLNDLQKRVQQIPADQWKQAGIGRKQAHQVNTDIRSDKTSWMTQEDPIEKEFLDYMESIRQGINQRLFMGLFDYESHFAIYPKGSFYQKHLDALKGKSNRVLSTVVYLNNDWQKDNGGELLIYKDSNVVKSVVPRLGTVVIFLSEGVPHEVLKANRERHSIAGWFRVNASSFSS